LELLHALALTVTEGLSKLLLRDVLVHILDLSVLELLGYFIVVHFRHAFILLTSPRVLPTSISHGGVVLVSSLLPNDVLELRVPEGVALP